jgi:hypothetical protein
MTLAPLKDHVSHSPMAIIGVVGHSTVSAGPKKGTGRLTTHRRDSSTELSPPPALGRPHTRIRRRRRRHWAAVAETEQALAEAQDAYGTADAQKAHLHDVKARTGAKLYTYGREDDSRSRAAESVRGL